MIRLYLFGPPRLERTGQPLEINLRKVLALFVYLAVTRQAHSRDALATLFWPEKDQQAARANLRRALYDLNQLVGQPVVEAAPEMVSLHATAALWLDIEQFQAHLADRFSSHTPAQALNATQLMPLVEAAELYTEDFLAGFTLPDCPGFDDWQFFQREELRSSLAALLQQLLLAYEAQGKYEEAVRHARRWLRLDPLEEAVHRRLMQLYALAGQPAATLRQYEECVRILAAELDVPPEEETTALYEAIRTRRFLPPDKVTRRQGDKVITSGELVTLSPPHPVTPSSLHSLPAQTTPFVGRQQELAELLRRLGDPACRLLTLVGPGGIGKTRLVIKAARTIDDLRLRIDDSQASSATDNHQSTIHNLQFKDGVFFVPLQPVNTPSGVIPAIADALGFQFYGGASPQEQLFNFLHEKQALLVLDNFEHLLAGADLVAEMLAAASGVKLLVTSREALRLQEEWFHPLAGMRLPPQASLQPPGEASSTNQKQEMIGTYDAVQLFIQTARRSLVVFELETHQEQIVRICRLVDGMPLGIELAASWLKVLSCAQIAQEIERGIDILVARHQNVPARHRNMRVVMEQSWQLLDEQTQGALKRLSVFQGGFLQDAAAAVAGAGLLTLAELVDKAWIYKLPGERYQMHELLRQFATEKLAEASTDQAETQDRHAIFYLQQVARREQALLGADQRVALDEISAEIDNVQAAWRRAADQCDFNLIDEALQALYRFFQIRSRYTEGEEHFVHTLRQLNQTTVGNDDNGFVPLRHRLLARIGAFRLAQGEIDAADADFSAVLRSSADARELAFVYAQLGNGARWRGNRPAAQAALRQSLALGRANGDQNQLAESLLVLSDIASAFSHFAEGERFAREALGLCRQLQRPDLTAHVLASLAWATNCLGAYAESERYYRESLHMAESIGNPFGIGLAIQFLGWVAYCEGGERLTEALSFYERAITIFRQIGHGNHLAMALGDYALAASERGDYAAALRFAQEGFAITETLDHRGLMAYNLNGMGAAACGLNNLEASWCYLLRSLQISANSQITDHVAVTLYFLARLLVQESKLAVLSDAQRLETQLLALELLSLVSHQQATWQLFRDRAQRAQAELAANLPVEIAAAAIERGQQRTLEDAVTQLLETRPTAASPQQNQYR